MASSFRLRVVTPERQLLDLDVEEVTAPGANGEIGILPDHIALLTTLSPGRLVYKSSGQRHVLAIFGGYAEVADNVMTVLADGAERVTEIDGEAAKRDEATAEEKLAVLDPSDAEFALVRQARDRAHARVAAVTAERTT